MKNHKLDAIYHSINETEERIKKAQDYWSRTEGLSIVGMQQSFRGKEKYDDAGDMNIPAPSWGTSKGGFLFEKKMLEMIKPAYSKVLSEYLIFLQSELEKQKEKLKKELEVEINNLTIQP